MPTRRNSKQMIRNKQEDCDADCEAGYNVPKTIPDSKLRTISDEYRRRDLSPDRGYKPNWRVNERTENIGARRLHTVMERLLEDASFNASDDSLKDASLLIDASYVDKQLGELSQDDDLSRFIL
jgi:hypothetical protein